MSRGKSAILIQLAKENECGKRGVANGIFPKTDIY
jgi:hypothetical protein